MLRTPCYLGLLSVIGGALDLLGDDGCGGKVKVFAFCYVGIILVHLQWYMKYYTRFLSFTHAK